MDRSGKKECEDRGYCENEKNPVIPWQNLNDVGRVAVLWTKAVKGHSLCPSSYLSGTFVSPWLGSATKLFGSEMTGTSSARAMAMHF